MAGEGENTPPPSVEDARTWPAPWRPPIYWRYIRATMCKVSLTNIDIFPPERAPVSVYQFRSAFTSEGIQPVCQLP
jgi:hypothetical protein